MADDDDLFDADEDDLLYVFLRSGALLDYADDGRLKLTAKQHARLERINKTPAHSDWEFLFGFDAALHALDDTAFELEGLSRDLRSYFRNLINDTVKLLEQDEVAPKHDRDRLTRRWLRLLDTLTLPGDCSTCEGNQGNEENTTPTPWQK